VATKPTPTSSGDYPTAQPPPSVLANKHFLRLWAAQALTMTAQNATWYTVMIVVEQSTRSSTQLSLAILSVVLPAALFGLVAGVVVDYANKRTMLVATNLLRAVTLLLYILHDIALWTLFVANFVFSCISQFFGPAEAAKIPLIVRRSQLLAANSLFNLTFSGAQLVGLVILGPTFVKLFGPDALFLCAAAIYVVGTVLVWQLPRAEPPHAPFQTLIRDRRTAAARVLAELRVGLAMARRDPALGFAIVQLTVAMGLMLIVAALAPRFVVAELAARAEDAVAVLAPAGFGVFIGALTVGQVAQRVGKLRLVRWCVPAAGVLFVIFGAAAQAAEALHVPELSMVTVMSVAGALGILFAWITIVSQTLLMERTPPAARGRMFAVQLTLGSAASILCSSAD
jgi:MFS family permease